MAAKTPIHHQREQQNYRFQQRCVIVAIFFGVFMASLGIRLVQLQLKDHSHYASLSENNTLSYIPVAPTRGLITDRRGEQLAINKPSATLVLMPNSNKALHQIIQELRAYIPIHDKEEESFFKSLGQYRHYQPIPLKSQLTEEQVALFYTNQYKLPGAFIENELLRYYPTGSTMGAVIGYVGRINNHDKAHVNFDNYQAQPVIGKTGLEKQYESELHGQSGAEVAETNANGHIIHLLKENPAIGGQNLMLTIDLRLQRQADELLQGIEGSIIMLDPRNGEILAMANAPSFDNNLFSGGISHLEYAKLLNDPEHPLFNRALRGRFAPGSTIKPFYSIASLNDKLITPNSSVYDRNGTFQIPGTDHVYHDWTWFTHRGGHGWVDVKKALETSCDVFYYDLANRMGIRKMDQILDQYGFGQPTGVDLPDELAGIVPTPEWKRKVFHQSWYTGDTIEAGIGQGYLSVTPLQLAASVAMLAMQGHRYQLHLVKTLTAPDGTMTSTPIVELPPGPELSESAWHTVVDGMQQVIDGKEGTAMYFGPHPNFTVAGKTGTAQVYGHHRDEEILNERQMAKKLRNNHLFVAFAPIDNPTVVIVVILEHEPKPDKAAGILLRQYFKLQQESKEGHA